MGVVVDTCYPRTEAGVMGSRPAWVRLQDPFSKEIERKEGREGGRGERGRENRKKGREGKEKEGKEDHRRWKELITFKTALNVCYLS